MIAIEQYALKDARRVKTWGKVLEATVQQTTTQKKVLSVEEVCRHSGISQATFYKNFGSKEKLYGIVGQAFLDELKSEVLTDLFELTPLETLEHFVISLTGQRMLPLLIAARDFEHTTSDKVTLRHQLANILAGVLRNCNVTIGHNSTVDLKQVAYYHISAALSVISDSFSEEEKCSTFILEQMYLAVGLKKY